MTLTAEQQRMVAENLGLCGWAVNRWFAYLPIDGNGYTQDDARQDAVFGLARAVELYDPERGYRFATYAAGWIRQSIQRGWGLHDGIDARRAIGYRLPMPDKPLELDYSDDTPESWIVDPADLEAHAIDCAAVAEIVALRERVCIDGRDLAVFDAMTATDDDRADAPRLQAVADTIGVSRQTCFVRWRALRHRIRVELNDCGAAS